MRYDVLESFPLDVGKTAPLEFKTGEVFVPATINVAQSTVAELVRTEKIRLIRPAGEHAKAAKKK